MQNDDKMMRNHGKMMRNDGLAKILEGDGRDFGRETREYVEELCR